MPSETELFFNFVADAPHGGGGAPTHQPSQHGYILLPDEHGRADGSTPRYSEHQQRIADMGGNQSGRDAKRYSGLGIEGVQAGGAGGRRRQRSSTIRHVSADAAGPPTRSKSLPWPSLRWSEEEGADSNNPDGSSVDAGDAGTSTGGQLSAPAQYSEKWKSSSTTSVADVRDSDDSGEGLSVTSPTATESSDGPEDSSGPALSSSPQPTSPATSIDVLSFLDPDSSAIPSEEAIQRAMMGTAAAWPGKTSPSRAGYGDDDTNRSSSPEQIGQGGGAQPGDSRRRRARPHNLSDRWAGSPATTPRSTGKSSKRLIRARSSSRGSQRWVADQPPPSGYELLAARLSGQDQWYSPGSPGRPPWHDESQEQGEAEDETYSPPPSPPPLRPMYRRFEALNHRLLLHMQDELSELEEQLRRLDTADTAARRVQGLVLPASRRAEALSGGELQWHKTDVLGKIGFKLSQYNQVLASFTKTQKLPPPSMEDVENYRTYLATQNPIAEIETRFLEPADDLVSLARPPYSPSSTSSSISGDEDEDFGHPHRRRRHRPTLNGNVSDDALTPMPRQGPFLPHPHTSPFSPSSSSSGWESDADGDKPAGRTTSRPRTASTTPPSMPPSRPRSGTGGGAAAMIPSQGPAPPVGRRNRKPPLGKAGIASLVFAAAVAVLVPVLTFTVIPEFVGRMAVVLLVLLAVVGASLQLLGGGGGGAGGGGREAGPSAVDVLLCGGAYGAVMAVIAGLL